MEDRYIVSIDLGTFKIALAVACVSGNDTRIVYYKETPANGMRSSRILNENKVAQQLMKAIGDAEDILGLKITGAVLGMPRFYVRMEENSAMIEREEDSYITEEEIGDLKNFAQDSYPIEDPEHETVYGAIAQSFSTDEEFQIIEDDIVGMSGRRLEGNFKVFIGNKSSLDRIDRVMKTAGIVAMKKYFVPQLTAEATLFPSEMENGVALIDFGGGCTSLSIYYKNVLRHYSSIPFGGMNVTKDIQMESKVKLSLAENIKLAYGACMPEKLQNLSEKQLLLKSENGEADKRLTVKYLSEIITAREEEIIRAMLYEIGRSNFADKLRNGIVITGGGARMTNLANFITELSGYAVRVGKPNFRGVFNCCTGLCSPAASTTVGLVMAARELGASCAFSKESAAAEEPQDAGDTEPTKLEQETGTLPGMVSEEDIARKKRLEEEKKRKDIERQEHKARRRSRFNAFWDRAKKVSESIGEGLGKEGGRLLDMMNNGDE